MTGDRLSLDRIARRWAAEADQAGSQPSDIADDLVNAALRGEFEFSVMPITEEPPENFDARLGVMVETFARDGAPVTAGQLQDYLKVRRNVSGAPVEEARRVLARDIDLSFHGFRLWCNRPEFPEWALSRGLSRPRFIDGQGPDASDAALPRQDKRTRRLSDSAASTTEKRKPGRPSLNLEIRAAYDNLVESQKITHPTTKTATYPIVRKRVREMFPDMVQADDRKGVGDEAIRNAIQDHFDENEAEAIPPKASP